MEGIPRIPLIALTCRTSSKVPCLDPLKVYIQSNYEDSAQSYEKEFEEFLNLRKNAADAPSTDEGVSLVMRYYCQLQLLKRRFPMGENEACNVSFTWNDHYMKFPIVNSDVSFEEASILYNIAAIRTVLGCQEERLDSESMKLACTHFQYAAWCFQRILDQSVSSLSPDMSTDLIKMLNTLMLAQAQECILEKSMLDNRKPALIAKISQQLFEYYVTCHKYTDSDDLEYICADKTLSIWKRFCLIKKTFYLSMTQYFMGLDAEERGKHGEAVTWLTAASKNILEVEKPVKDTKEPRFQDTYRFAVDVIQGKFTSAKKDNDFVYHDVVPDLARVNEVRGASLVKGIGFDVCDGNIAGRDIFQRLLPLDTLQATSVFSEKVASLLRSLADEMDARNLDLEKVLTSLNLSPEDLRLEDRLLSQEVYDLSATLHANSKSVDRDLANLMQTLVNDSVDAESAVQSLQDMIVEEVQEESEFQTNTGKQFLPTKLYTEAFSQVRKECQDLCTTLTNASSSNALLRDHLQRGLVNVKRLLQPLDEIEAQLPSVMTLKNEAWDLLSSRTDYLLNKVATMRTQRREFMDTLRTALQKEDISQLLLANRTSSNGKVVPDEVVFEKVLSKFQPQVDILQQNFTAQSNIVDALIQHNADVSPLKQLIKDTKQKREEEIDSLVRSYEEYQNLVGKCDEAKVFYRSVMEKATSLQQKINTLKNFRGRERDENLSRLQQQKAAALPTVPAPPSPQQSHVASLPPGMPTFSAAGPPMSQDLGNGDMEFALRMQQQYGSSDKPKLKDFLKARNAMGKPNASLPRSASPSGQFANPSYSPASPQRMGGTASYPPSMSPSLPPSTSVAGVMPPTSGGNPQQTWNQAQNPSNASLPPTFPQEYYTSQRSNMTPSTSQPQPTQPPLGMNHMNPVSGHYSNTLTMSAGVSTGASSSNSAHLPPPQVQSAQHPSGMNFYQTPQELGHPHQPVHQPQPFSHSGPTPFGSAYPPTTLSTGPAPYPSHEQQNTDFAGYHSPAHMMPSGPPPQHQVSMGPTSGPSWMAQTYPSGPPPQHQTSTGHTSRSSGITQMYPQGPPHQASMGPPSGPSRMAQMYPSGPPPQHQVSMGPTSGPSAMAQLYPQGPPQHQASMGSTSGTLPQHPESMGPTSGPSAMAQLYPQGTPHHQASMGSTSGTLPQHPAVGPPSGPSGMAQMYPQGPSQHQASMGSTSGTLPQHPASMGPPSGSSGMTQMYPPDPTQSQALIGSTSGPSWTAQMNSSGPPPQHQASVGSMSGPSGTTQMYPPGPPPQHQTSMGSTSGPPGMVPTHLSGPSPQHHPSMPPFSGPTGMTSATPSSISSQQPAPNLYQAPPSQPPILPVSRPSVRSNVDLLSGSPIEDKGLPLPASTTSKSTNVASPPTPTLTPVTGASPQHQNRSPADNSPSSNNTSKPSSPKVTTNGKPPSSATNFAPVLVPTVLSTEELIRQRKEEQLLMQQLRHTTQDPLLDNLKLNYFITEVERTLKKLHQSGEESNAFWTQEWKRVEDKIREKLMKMKTTTAAARCSSTKNRFQEFVPYDSNRIVLTQAKDDYINASLIEVKLSEHVNPRYIACQAPLPNTSGDFWLMVLEQGCEVCVHLGPALAISESVHDSTEKTRVVEYWPTEKGRMQAHGNLDVNLQAVKSKENWTEYVVTMKNRATQQARTVTHFVYTEVAAKVPHHEERFAAFIRDVHLFYRQQRNPLKPMVVISSSGCGIAGVFIASSAAMLYMESEGELCHFGDPWLWEEAVQRPFLLECREQFLAVWRTLMQHATHILAKKGIVVGSSVPPANRSTSVSSAPPPSPMATSGDVIQNAIVGNLSDFMSGATSVMATTGVISTSVVDSSSRRSSFGSTASSTHAADRPARVDSTERPPATSNNTSDGMDLLKSLSHNLSLEPIPKSQRKITRHDFERHRGGNLLSSNESDPADPLSSLNPLWNFSSLSATTPNSASHSTTNDKP